MALRGASQVTLVVKNPPANAGDTCKRHGFNPCVGKVPWRRKWHSTPVLLAGESHGPKSLASYSSWARRESDVTEETWHTRTVALCYSQRKAASPGTRTQFLAVGSTCLKDTSFTGRKMVVVPHVAGTWQAHRVEPNRWGVILSQPGLQGHLTPRSSTLSLILLDHRCFSSESEKGRGMSGMRENSGAA